MAFYTNPGWSNLTPPPVSEQNLNDMSNALEKALYSEDGKIKYNDGTVVEVGNMKITFGSYVGNGSSNTSFTIPENQDFFVMLSEINGLDGAMILSEIVSQNQRIFALYPNGFIVGAKDGIGFRTYTSYDLYFTDFRINETQISMSGGLLYNSGSRSATPQYNSSGVTYHYATIGV